MTHGERLRSMGRGYDPWREVMTHGGEAMVHGRG